MRKRALICAVAAAALGGAGALATSAGALNLFVGKTVVKATATIAPARLPARGNAPVSVTSTVRVATSDGSTPPQLTAIDLQFDRHGSIDTRGLPTCTMAKLAGTTTARARAVCRRAIVGEGIGRAVVDFPGQPEFSISSPLVLFNAPPQQGRPSLIVHAYEKVPTPQAVLTPISVERIHKGRYGYAVHVEMPEIAGGFGVATLSKATVDRTWTRGGRTVGYANAHCAGGQLQVYGELRFVDDGFANGTVIQGCQVAR